MKLRYMFLLRVAARIAPSFGKHISNVLALCPKKQMIRITTGWVIASMTDTHAFGNRAIDKLPSESMSEVILLPKPRLSVSVVSLAAIPLPAFIDGATIDALPKGLRSGLRNVVPWREPIWLPNVNAIPDFAFVYGNSRLLSAPALAFAIGVKQAVFSDPGGVLGYVLRKTWGIIGAHKKFTFLVSKLRTVPAVAGLFLLATTPVIIPQEVAA